MINLKKTIEDRVEKEMSFLKKITIEQSDSKSGGFISRCLLPYLFYVNTIDKKYRILPIFLSRNEDIIHLPLFYSLGLFKTYADLFLSLNKYENRDFLHESLDILDLKGSVCKLENINFTSKELLIRTGSGKKTVIDFDSYDFFELERRNRSTAYYTKLKIIFEEIESFKSNLNISQNPLELIGKMNDDTFRRKNTYNGALFFTHNPSLLKSEDFKDFLINDKSFLNTIPTSRLSLKDGKINYTRLADSRSKSGKELNKLPEFIVFSKFENYNGYFAVQEEKNWLNTIVFDFTKDTRELEGVLNVISNQYQPCLNHDKIKDIYMLFNEKDIFSYNKIISHELNVTPFILGIDQKRGFLGVNESSKAIQFQNINNNDFSKEFNYLINSAREFCKEVHLIDLFGSLISPLYELKYRMNSFYNPKDINDKINDIINFLDEIKENALLDSRYNERFEQCDLLLKELSQKLHNAKLEFILNSIDSNPDSICIISFNDNQDDLHYLKSQIPSHNVDFLNPKGISNTLTKLKDYKKVYILNSNQGVTVPLILNPVQNDVLFVLNKPEYDAIQRTQGSLLLKNLCNNEKLAEILNLDEFNSKDEGILPPESSHINETDSLIEPDIEGFINSIIKENALNRVYSNYTKNKSDNLILVFKDGTSITVPESKYYFIHKENIQSLKECHIQAKDLQHEDLIFILNHNADEFEHMIWNISEGYPAIKEILEDDLSWRTKIDNYVSENNISYSDLKTLLNNNNYNIGSAQAIQTWVNNDVYEPRGILKLTTALAELDIISQNDIVKTANSVRKVKKLKTRLPHELRLYHIAQLNDLEYNNNFIFPELIENMYQFMDIKTISLIIK